jgi:hypothetical protein
MLFTAHFGPMYSFIKPTNCTIQNTQKKSRDTTAARLDKNTPSSGSALAKIKTSLKY